MNGTFYNIICLKIWQILSQIVKKLYSCAKNLILNRAFNFLYFCKYKKIILNDDGKRWYSDT